eukprot:1153229-Pelagomonas_calceolata.AAC.4
MGQYNTPVPPLGYTVLFAGIYAAALVATSIGIPGGKLNLLVSDWLVILAHAPPASWDKSLRWHISRRLPEPPELPGMHALLLPAMERGHALSLRTRTCGVFR